MKPTKWEIACPSCKIRWEVEANVRSDSGKRFPGIVSMDCMACGTSCASEPQLIKGSAPPFVPMSDRPFPFYWESFESNGYTCESVCLTPPHPDARSSRYARSVWLFIPDLLKDYETRLAHLCWLIARRRERQIHNYLMTEPIAVFRRKPGVAGARIRLGLMMGGRNLNVRFAAGAVFGAGAESHIFQPKFAALRGAALRGKA